MLNSVWLSSHVFLFTSLLFDICKYRASIPTGNKWLFFKGFFLRFFFSFSVVLKVLTTEVNSWQYRFYFKKNDSKNNSIKKIREKNVNSGLLPCLSFTHLVFLFLAKEICITSDVPCLRIINSLCHLHIWDMFTERILSCLGSSRCLTASIVSNSGDSFYVISLVGVF